MSNMYKRVVKNISVPKELIEKTAFSMRQAQDRKTAAKPLRYIWFIIPAVCAVSLSLLLIIIPSFIEPDIFITELTDDCFTERVELTDGLLLFQQDSKDNAPLVLSGPGIIKEEWSLEKYNEYLGADVTPSGLPRDMSVAEETAVVYMRGDGGILWDYRLTRFEFTKGGTLEIIVSKEKLPPQRRYGCEENSEIGGNPLAVGFDSETCVYFAQFLYNGVGVYAEGEGLSQEAFIYILHDFFK